MDRLNGSLSPAETVYTSPTGLPLGSVKLADFNGDGLLDIAVVNQANVTVIPNDGDGTFGPSFDVAVGSYPHALAVGDFNGDGKPDIAVTDSGYFATGSVTVALNQPDATQLVFGTQPSNAVAGTAVSPAVTVRVENQAGQVVTSDNTDRVTLSLRDTNGDSLLGNVVATVVNGVATFNNVSIQQTGTGDKLAASSGGLTTGVSAAFNVAPAALDHLSLSTPASVTAGTSFNMAVSARDKYGNLIPSYTGTVRFTTSDASTQAKVPAAYTFTSADHGVHTFSGAILVTANSNSVMTVTNTSNTAVRGQAVIDVVGGAADHLILTAPSAITAGVTFGVTIDIEDRYNNLASGYTGTVHFASTERRRGPPSRAITHSRRPMLRTMFLLGPSSRLRAIRRLRSPTSRNRPFGVARRLLSAPRPPTISASPPASFSQPECRRPSC